MYKIKQSSNNSSHWTQINSTSVSKDNSVNFTGRIVTGKYIVIVIRNIVSLENPHKGSNEDKAKEITWENSQMRINLNIRLVDKGARET